MELFLNLPLWTALTAICLTQSIKVPIYYLANRSWDLRLLFSTGGMPSSHSAAVTSLTTAIGLEYGLDSGLFALSCIFSIIVMFDAAGVRRHAGEHAALLNKLVEEFNQLIQEMKNWTIHPEQEKRKKLKELLGHQPSEVLVGGLFGIGIGLLLHYLAGQM